MSMQDWFQIGGQTYNVRVIEVTEEANVLYTDNSGRTMAVGAPMTLDPLGTFINHKIDVAVKKGYESDFDALYEYVIQPRSVGVPVKVVHNQTVLNYNAYISSSSRKVKRINENSTYIDARSNPIKVKWERMSINCIPIEAQITP